MLSSITWKGLQPELEEMQEDSVVQSPVVSLVANQDSQYPLLVQSCLCTPPGLAIGVCWSHVGVSRCFS
ncbi:hypothetical protein EYF80_053544 [Liparis tanakae]|uniref:Uncharacterized protein n=1 Tax=Liparis tanakae TaxID=230148 RepID=A0A4Z2F559_9TELE|nr:hypothetical protein EYF80_053544 [Liparis tanakae]